MSHELTMIDGTAEMAYVGETPWHGLGQKLQAGASIEEWKKSARMDWEIAQAPVEYSYRTDAGILVRPKMADKKVLFRADTKAALGVVGTQYAVVQPGDVLEFFRDLTQDAGFTLETAGTMFGGRKFWALARIGDKCEIVPGDRVGGYLLLVTSADGTMATTAKFTTVRVVCNNTLSMSLDGKSEHKARHRSAFDPVAMKSKLGLAHSTFETFKTRAQLAVERAVSELRAEDLTLKLLAPAGIDTLSDADQIKALTRVSNSAGYSRIMALFSGAGRGSKLDGVAGTAWGWVNAVTEYVDHEKTAKSLDHRIESAFMGKGDILKTRAFDMVTAV